MKEGRLRHALAVGSIVAANGCGAPQVVPAEVPPTVAEQNPREVRDVLALCRNAKKDLMDCLAGEDGKPLALDLITYHSHRVISRLWSGNEVPNEWISAFNELPFEIPADVKVEFENNEMKLLSKGGFRFIFDGPLTRQFLPLALMLVDDFIDFTDKEEQGGKLKISKQKPMKIMHLSFVQFETSDKENNPQQYLYNNTFKYNNLDRIVAVEDSGKFILEGASLVLDKQGRLFYVPDNGGDGVWLNRPKIYFHSNGVCLSTLKAEPDDFKWSDPDAPRPHPLIVPTPDPITDDEIHDHWKAFLDTDCHFPGGGEVFTQFQSRKSVWGARYIDLDDFYLLSAAICSNSKDKKPDCLVVKFDKDGNVAKFNQK